VEAVVLYPLVSQDPLVEEEEQPLPQAFLDQRILTLREDKEDLPQKQVVLVIVVLEETEQIKAMEILEDLVALESSS
jgi:hypothetical protein